MTLQERLSADLREAAKKGDVPRRTALRLVLASAKNAEKARGASLDDAGVMEVIGKQAKRHRESIGEFARGNRQDLVDREEAELAVLLEYLPQQMGHDELVEAARSVIDQVGARGPGDKGKVMARLMAQVKGKADGREVNQVVSDLLSAL
ncbi:MAG: GatB/YqeY domain-containing protein [Chloroflexota bacterium]